MELADMEEIQSLVRKARSREVNQAERHNAFGEIVGRFQDMAYGCACTVLADFQLAEDAAQEAFMEAYRNLDKVKDPKAFAGWFRQIVLRQCYRIKRRRSPPTEPIEVALGLPSTEADPAEAALKNELKDRVLTAIAALRENQRMVTTLFYIDGYSQNEIADFLETPMTTIKKRLQYARNRLKERLITMVQDTFAQQRPSRNQQLIAWQIGAPRSAY